MHVATGWGSTQKKGIGRRWSHHLPKIMNKNPNTETSSPPCRFLPSSFPPQQRSEIRTHAFTERRILPTPCTPKILIILRCRHHIHLHADKDKTDESWPVMHRTDRRKSSTPSSRYPSALPHPRPIRQHHYHTPPTRNTPHSPICVLFLPSPPRLPSSFSKLLASSPCCHSLPPLPLPLPASASPRPLFSLSLPFPFPTPSLPPSQRSPSARHGQRASVPKTRLMIADGSWIPARAGLMRL